MDNTSHFLDYTAIKEVIKKIVASDYNSFFIKAFNTLHPSCRLEYNWHIELILRYLNEIENGKLKRLIINIPPRFLKSLCVSVAWPALLLAKDPSKKIIVASYNKELGRKHSQDCRLIIQSKWYRECFSNSVISNIQNTQNKFITKFNGFRFATSVNSTLTGEGADLIIVDDPQTPLQALSKYEREKTIKWFEQTLMSRLNDHKNGAIVIVMQRLHSDDLSGYLLKKGGWNLLKIPIIDKKTTFYQCREYSYLRKANEPLHASRHNGNEIYMLKRELGEYAFCAQYLQDPLTLQSNFLKKLWFKYYDSTNYCESISNSEMVIYQSWDCAIKMGKTNDYTVCITLGYYEGNYYLLDVFRNKIDYPLLKNIIIENYKKFFPEFVLVEDKASGQQIIQELQKEIPIIPITPRYDKLMRFLLITPIIESGKLLLPNNTIWVHEFERELLEFPHGKNDDQVDALTQLLQWLTKKMHSASIKRYIGVL